MGQIQKQASRWTSAHPIDDLSKDVVTLSKTYSDGYVSDWHHHRRWQLIHAVYGLMIVETFEGRWTVPPQYGLIVPGGVSHTTRMIGQVELRTVYVEPDAFAARQPPAGVVIRPSPLFALVIERLCAYANSPERRPDFDPLCLLVIHEMATATPCPLALPMPQDTRLAAICEALIAHPSKVAQIDLHAFDVGMSRRTFTRAFAAQTGLSFGDWTRRLKCQVALEAEQRGENFAAVSARLGYGSPYALRAMMDKLLHQV